MKVRQLIEKLRQLPQDMEVHQGYDYGDRPHTTVCPEITEVSDEEVVHSEYHRLPKLIDDDNREYYEKDTTLRRVVVLR